LQNQVKHTKLDILVMTLTSELRIYQQLILVDDLF
jgi:hypothetical protein